MQDVQGKSKQTAAGRRRLVRRVVWIAVVLGSTALLVLALLPKPVLVDTAPVTQGELIVTVEEDGRTRVKNRYVVAAPLSGSLGRIELNPGDLVKEGEVVARIVPVAPPLLDVRSQRQAEARVSAGLAAKRQAEAQIDRAQAALDFARREAERVRELVNKEVIGSQELDQALVEQESREAELAAAKFAAQVAQYELLMARSALGYNTDQTGRDGAQFEIPSPITGQVLAVQHKSAGPVQTGAPLLELGDSSTLEVVADVLTTAAVDIQPQAPVIIDGWGGVPLKAHVRLIEPAAFTRVSALGIEEQRVNAIIELDESQEAYRALGDGYRVVARIQTARVENARKIPVGALFRQGERWAVFAVRSGRAVLVPIEVGKRNDEEVQVVKGLEQNDEVIVHPSDRVGPGVRVDRR